MADQDQDASFEELLSKLRQGSESEAHKILRSYIGNKVSGGPPAPLTAEQP